MAVIGLFPSSPCKLIRLIAMRTGVVNGMNAGICSFPNLDALSIFVAGYTIVTSSLLTYNFRCLSYCVVGLPLQENIFVNQKLRFLLMFVYGFVEFFVHEQRCSEYVGNFVPTIELVKAQPYVTFPRYQIGNSTCLKIHLCYHITSEFNPESDPVVRSSVVPIRLFQRSHCLGRCRQ